MKSIVVFIVALFVVSSTSHEDHYFEQEFHECAAKLGINDDDIPTLIAKGDRSIGCIYACVLEKFDAFEGDDHLKLDKIKKIVKKVHAGDPRLPEILKDAEKCTHKANEEGTGRCETAEILVECSMEEMKHK